MEISQQRKHCSLFFLRLSRSYQNYQELSHGNSEFGSDCIGLFVDCTSVICHLGPRCSAPLPGPPPMENICIYHKSPYMAFLSTRPIRLGELPPVSPFTKPPLFQRNGLTCSGNPLFESCVEGKAKQREISVYSRSSFQRPQR